MIHTCVYPPDNDSRLASPAVAHTNISIFSRDHQLQPLILYNRKPSHLHLLNDDSVSHQIPFSATVDWGVGGGGKSFLQSASPEEASSCLFDLSLGNA
ncbi:hypothetical protein CEXT_320801 [Caerostris extrusa]|uniref:Uncharacterized protein n=1 Tax=Caerostris extrusa TaxID=172846 RepID=A0AAV4VY68_CAEEX|nr:hypothetical protein CEXT_320801 [Caerostris extrusa]